MIEDRYFVKIVIYCGAHAEATIYFRYWLPNRLIVKYRWYFDYLAALVKIKNPRKKVEVFVGPQNELCGQDFIDKKLVTRLQAKQRQLEKLNKPIAQNDLFGFQEEANENKRAKLIPEIEALERGEYKYYVPVTYINLIREYAKISPNKAIIIYR